MTDQRTALLDGDVYCYQAAAAVQRVVNWGGDCDDTCLYSLWADLGEATEILDATIEDLKKAVGADRVVFALSAPDNFRSDIYPDYKGNRKNVLRPIVLAPLRQYAREHYECWERPGLEGDDILGILATNNAAVPGEKVMVTIDKDLLTIPGFHYNSGKPGEGIREVTPEEADLFHLAQGIAGDPTDGYPGCPGVGMKTAQEFLEDPHKYVPVTRTLKSGPRAGQEQTRWVREELGEGETLWDAIVSLYARAGLNEEFALTQFQVARICRSSDYDFKQRKVIPWTPEKL